jgi:diguanylate cyclase
MKLFSYAAVLVGILFLLFSLRPIIYISKTERNIGWKILSILILFFILGYILFCLDIFTRHHIDVTDVLISSILFGGAVFVVLVIKLSQYSILKTNDIATKERYNSLHDDLTGLANRKYLIESLTELIEKENPFSLFMIDLNNFKQINDGLGHQFGDNFLIAVSTKLQDSVMDWGTFYRIGGDEFAITFNDTDQKKINDLVDTLHRSLNIPIIVDNYPMKTSISIGITLYPENGNEVFSLLKQADLAMYESKTNQCRYAFYHNDLGDDSYERLNLLIKLSEAIRYSEFELFYQPIIEASSGETTSYEALIRWPQASGGSIAPGVFIPIAEKSALICLLTQWVINQAAMDLFRLRQRGFTGNFHINLSAKDLLNDDIVDQIDSLMASGKLKADDFTFEITEGAMFEDLERAKRVIQAINRRGFSFSIDDFGTGFSSLVLLRELPINQIKIDRSFINGFGENETNRSIVYSVLNLAKDINCSVVAEGVETQEMSEVLRELGCTYLQGYYFSEPMPLSKIWQ